MDKKLLLIGVDGLTLDLILPWIKEGKLENFKKIMENGSFGTLRSTIPPLSCPAIPCLFTGKNPAKLDIFNFIKLGKTVNSTDIKEKAIWDYLGDYGLRSMILHVPLTYPAKPLNGMMISGELIPEINEKCFYPRTVMEDIKKEVTVGQLWEEDLFEINEKKGLEKTNKLIDEEIRVTKERLVHMSKHMNDYDFSFIWIIAGDDVQHFFWNNENEMYRFFSSVDEEIGKIISKFKGVTMILSDHGFEDVATKNLRINIWLRNQGYLFQKGNLLKGIYNKVERFIPKDLVRKAILDRKRAETKTDNIGKSIPFIDWKKTFAYKDRFGIRIIKENCKDYELLRDEIIKKLKEFTDNGKKVFREVLKREDIFSGKYFDEVPDIILLDDKDYELSYDLAGELFEDIKESTMSGVKISGTHNFAINGTFMAIGENVKIQKIENASIYDIFPTILYYFGLEIPKDADGKVLDIFKSKIEKSEKKEEVTKDGLGIDMNKLKNLLKSGKI